MRRRRPFRWRRHGASGDFSFCHCVERRSPPAEQGLAVERLDGQNLVEEIESLAAVSPLRAARIAVAQRFLDVIWRRSECQAQLVPGDRQTLERIVRFRPCGRGSPGSGHVEIARRATLPSPDACPAGLGSNGEPPAAGTFARRPGNTQGRSIRRRAKAAHRNEQVPAGSTNAHESLQVEGMPKSLSRLMAPERAQLSG